jgi:hypothetical protein
MPLRWFALLLQPLAQLNEDRVRNARQPAGTPAAPDPYALRQVDFPPGLSSTITPAAAS